MYTPTLSKSQEQLFKAFCGQNKKGQWVIFGSGIETSEGTRPRWNFLKQGGLITKMPYGGAMGHPFSFNLTTERDEFLQSVCNEMNQAHADDATESERNDFSK